MTLADVQAAAETIQGAVRTTPTARSETLSAITGAHVWLKFENLQFTGAFKERGARNFLAALSPTERARGVVAASAGNHAQGVAYHAHLLGIEATIVMPADTPFGKVSNTAHLGGLLVGYLYLRNGRGGLSAEIKYRYLKWKMNRLRRKFDVYSGGRSDWDRKVH